MPSSLARACPGSASAAKARTQSGARPTSSAPSRPVHRHGMPAAARRSTTSRCGMPKRPWRRRGHDRERRATRRAGTRALDEVRLPWCPSFSTSARSAARGLEQRALARPARDPRAAARRAGPRPRAARASRRCANACWAARGGQSVSTRRPASWSGGSSAARSSIATPRACATASSAAKERSVRPPGGSHSVFAGTARNTAGKPAGVVEIRVARDDEIERVPRRARRAPAPPRARPRRSAPARQRRRPRARSRCAPAPARRRPGRRRGTPRAAGARSSAGVEPRAGAQAASSARPSRSAVRRARTQASARPTESASASAPGATPDHAGVRAASAATAASEASPRRAASTSPPPSQPPAGSGRTTAGRPPRAPAAGTRTR